MSGCGLGHLTTQDDCLACTLWEDELRQHQAVFDAGFRAGQETAETRIVAGIVAWLRAWADEDGQSTIVAGCADGIALKLERGDWRAKEGKP